MKIFKRTVSLMLAFLMIFSSFSLLASAELNDGNENSAVFYTKFYRNDGGTWVPTDAIKRGEQVKARVFIESDYMVGTSNIFWLYSKKFMSHNTEGYLKTGITWNLDPIENTTEGSIPVVNSWDGFFTTATEPGGVAQNDAATMLINDGYLEESAFNDYGWIAVYLDSGSAPEKLTIGSEDNNDLFADKHYVFEFTFDVLQDSTETEGLMYIPTEAIQDTTDHDYAFTFLGRAKKATSFVSTEGWEEDYSLDVTNTNTPLPVESTATFNAGADGHYGLGTDGEANTTDDIKSTSTSGEVDTELKLPKENPTPYSATKVFKGWALATDETNTVLSTDEIAALAYGYNNIAFNAVYEAASATYILKVVEMDAEGNYPSDEEIAAIAGTPVASQIGAVINAKDYTPVPEGFDIANPEATVTVNATDDDILIVKLARKTVSVTFDGGDTVTGLYGSTQNAPVKATDAGYSNEGWYNGDVKLTGDGGEFKMPAVATNYTSNVIADKQDVIVNITYFDAVLNQPVTVLVTMEDATVTGNKVEITETAQTPVEGTDYILLSDIVAKTNIEHFVYDSESTSNNLSGTASAAGLTLTVGYKAKNYNVTFDTATNALPDVKLTAAYGSTVSEEKLPSKEQMENVNPGYTFEGWYNGEEKFEADKTQIKGDTTFTAKYTANKVKIIYEYAGDEAPEGEEFALPATITDAVIGQKVVLPEITAPEGYEFKWTVSNTAMYDGLEYTVYTQDVTVTGTWKLKEYKISYYSNDAKTDLIETKTLKYGDTIPADFTATQPGKIFNEWSYETEDGTAVAPAKMPAYNLNAVAVFTEVIYTVQFIKYEDIISGEAYVADTDTAKYFGAIDKVVDTTEEGYRFTGWKYEDGTDAKLPINIEFLDEATGEYTLIPVVAEGETDNWILSGYVATAKVYATYVAKTIDVEFDPDGGYFMVDGMKDTESQIVPTLFGEVIEKPADPQKDGYTFNMWDPEWVDGQKVESEDVYYIAQWLPNVMFEFAGNVPEEVSKPEDMLGVDFDNLVTVPVFSVDGYNYTVTISSEDAFDNEDGTFNMGSTPVTVTYTWAPSDHVQYKVNTFLADVGTATYTAKETLTRYGVTGETITLSDADKALYKGFEFSKLDPADAVIDGHGTTEVNAYYNRKMISVTVLDGTGATISETEVQFGDKIDKPAEEPASPNKGEAFDKWVFADGSDVDFSAAVNTVDPIVIKPAYKKINYSVTYTQTGDVPAGYELPNAEFANTATANYGSAVAVPAWNNDTVPGYNVAITVTGAEGAEGAYTVGEGNVTVNAAWSYDKFAVNYVTNGTAPAGYTLPHNVAEATLGTAVEIPEWVSAGAPAGYKLEMKIEGAVQQNDGSYEVYNSDVTVTATWTYEKYTVDYVTVGIAPEGYELPADITDAIIGTTFTVPAWNNDTVPGYNVTIAVEHAINTDGVYSVGTQNVTVTATWTYDKYIVDYVTVGDAPAGYELPADITDAIIGTTFTVPAWNDDTVDGYNVTIKVENAVENGGVYSVGTQNVTVTATWTYEQYTVTYSFDSSAPAGAVAPAAVNAKIGDPIDLSSPTSVDGYEFVKWIVTGAVDNGDGTYKVGAGNVTVVGSWKALGGITYKVQRWFEILSEEGQYAAEGEPVILTGVAGEVATYNATVKGFNLDHIAPADAVIKGDGTTLINAYYTRKDISVTYLNEAGEVDSSTTVKFGGEIENPGVVTSADSGMKFAYWAYEDETPVDAWPITVTEETAIVLKPVFDENTYTVRFLFTTEAGEEKVYTFNDAADYKSAIAKPTGVPVKTGYTFVEWRKVDVNGDAWAETDTVPVGGIDYHAYFTPNNNISYQIVKKFQGIGTAEIDPALTQYDFVDNQTAGQMVTLDLDALAVPGFTIDTANSTYELIVKGDGSTVFELIYARNNVVVTINGEDLEFPAGDTITKDELEEIIEDTKDNGYNYVEWKDENGDTVTFPYTVPATGAVLTPVVEPKDIVLTFLDKDGATVATQNVKYKDTITPPDYPIVDGYKATGWFNVDDGTALPATVPAADATYKVSYTSGTHTEYRINVYVMDINGEYSISTSTVGYGTTGDTARIVPETLVGLYDDVAYPERKIEGIIEADGSTVLKIFYARRQYTVTYDGGEPINVFYGAAVPTIDDPARVGKKFTGWTPAIPSAMPAENLKFTSTWEDVMYKITYIVNGVQNVVEYKYGDTIITPADPEEPGMKFTGWTPAIPKTMPAEDIIIVAQFGTSFYTATFLDANGETFAEYTVMYGQSIIIPEGTPTKEHHTFVKWSNVPETMPADNIVIVPEFSRNPVKLIPMEGSTTIIDRDNMIIYGLKTTLSESILRNSFLDVEGDGYFTITVANDMAGFYGTGAKVSLYDNADTSGQPIETYTIIVFGDINGDARINATDSSMISSEISAANMDELWSYNVLATYDQYKVMAADINGDGRIDSTDSSTISNATLGSVRIDQVTKEVIRADA